MFNSSRALFYFVSLRIHLYECCFAALLCIVNDEFLTETMRWCYVPKLGGLGCRNKTPQYNTWCK